MKTAWQTTHKHTVAGRATTATGGHSHDLAEVEAALAAEVAAGVVADQALGDAIAWLDARLAALEASAPPPLPITSVRVTSIPDLLTRLEDDDLDEIVVANGTYRVSPAAAQSADSLWIGARYAARTRPVRVRPEAPGGVTFDGGGATYFGGIAFEGGAHDQDWRAFGWANGVATHTGVIAFGGANGAVDLPAVHHIAMRRITLAASLRGTGGGSGATDHGVYISRAIGGVHDIMLEDFDVDGSPADGLHSALHLYHSTPDQPNGHTITARRWRVRGTNQAIIVWDATVRDIVVEDVRIENARSAAVRYEQGGTLTLRRVISSGTPGGKGFYSSLGANPPGVTFEACDLR